MSVRILVGDAREKLRELPDESIHCVITSPPYWGLRSYNGDPGMIGLEETFDEHLGNLVAVFREVWRVLRKDGTLWLNYGDAYAGSWGAQSRGYGDPKGTSSVWGGQIHAAPKGTHTGSIKRAPSGLKPKDLMMMPARVAMALQADGWWLRSEIVWHKPNPMPESVTDRPTSAHEKLFLLSKSARYFYDAEAVRVPLGESTPPSGANLRNVWKIATHSFSQAHFATFPPALVEPCIKAGTSERGACPECGAPWARVVESTGHVNAREPAHVPGNTSTKVDSTGWKPTTYATGSWEPTCGCEAEICRDCECRHHPETLAGEHVGCECECHSPPQPCTVLDPFAGAGTVGLVADRLGRDAILIEISAEYAEMGRDRIVDSAPLFVESVLE